MQSCKGHGAVAMNTVSLNAMSADQRRLVEHHLPLVRLTYQRHRHLGRAWRTGREPTELFQEGCLALIEAVRNHDPVRHGCFATYAMARIHFAISQYAHEHQSLIRVPFSTQRRRRSRRNDLPCDRHCPDRLPDLIDMMDDDHSHLQRSYPARPRVRPAVNLSEGVTVGDLIREQIERAMRRVGREMKNDPRCADGNRKVVDRCLKERWEIPEPAAQTPIRQMARTLRCSVGRITHCEARFRRKLAAALINDAIYRRLRSMARQQTQGMQHRLSRDELDRLHVLDVGKRQSQDSGKNRVNG